MAPKRKQAPRKPPMVHNSAQRPQTLKNVITVIGVLILAGLASPISQLSLTPVYGSIPASIYHQRAVTLAAVLAFMVRSTFNRYIPTDVKNFLPVIAYWAPVIQYGLFSYSAQLGPTYGPLVTEALTYLPIIFLSSLAAAQMLDTVDLTSINPTIAEIGPAIGSYMIISFVDKAAASILPNVIGTHDLLTRSGLQVLLASAYAALCPSLLVLLAVPAMVHTVRVNPHYWSETATATLNRTLETFDFTLLDRHESNTGYISVLENRKDGLRVLRCDHSLLGGEWLVNEERRKQGQTVPEPIYGVFTMLEGVQLLETASAQRQEKSALVIGLGIGTSPKSLIENGINTTIVELDPVVHYYATKHFGLPNNHTAAIQDAVKFVDEVSEYAPSSYDYIIHDVFTGGAEPVMLFTLEFLEGLKKLLRDDGGIAINYAGDLSLAPSKLVLNTIHQVFPACRLFRETARAADATESSMDFINMIIFCVKNDKGRGKAAITFRQPTAGDVKGSISRARFLRPKAELEVDYKSNLDELKTTLPIVKRGATGELEKSHVNSAVSHWKIMRTVLPDAIWENW